MAPDLSFQFPVSSFQLSALSFQLVTKLTTEAAEGTEN
jgi:hypothetical protein